MATWNPDPGRLSAIKRAKAWYTGLGLETDSGTLFWSEASPTSMWTESGPVRRESRIHVPVAADLALTAADFLFGGGVNITTAETANDDLLAEVLPGILDKLTLGADRASGVGEVYYRVGWEDERAFVSLVDAAKVSPTWRYGRMTQATVRHNLPRYEDRDWIHYETYRPGTITHELYLIDAGDSNPVRQPLARHPETLAIVEDVEDLPDEERLTIQELTIDLPGDGALKGRLALKPILNKDPRDPGRPGGASDTDGSEMLMAMVDNAITSLDRDVRLGKARVIVDENMLNRNSENLTGIRFDSTAEIFAPIMASNYKGEILQVVQFDVRAEAHLATARDAIRRIVALAGYSPESLVTEASAAPEAAAARRLREARSLRTTGSKAARWIPVITEIVQDVMVIQAALRNQALAIPELAVELRESVSPDLAERAVLVTQMVAAKVMARRTGIQMLHPDWDDARVTEELDLIGQDGPDVSLGGLF